MRKILVIVPFVMSQDNLLLRQHNLPAWRLDLTWSSSTGRSRLAPPIIRAP